jgi:cobalamin biosynthesis protein CobW
MTAKIPVTIITGFLGSGKTTLIRNLIQNSEGRRLAVVVNEFGEMGIDGEILKSCCSNEEDILELSNGCLCCTVQEEFLPMMLKLMEKKDTIDHIIIETSGLALPKPLLHAFNWPELKPQITVDAVITVVDAVGQATGEICDRERVQAQRLADDTLDHETPIEELFEDQLSCADLIIMTKKDMLSEEAFKEVRAVMENKRRPDVQIITADHGVVPTSIILGVNAEAENDLESRHSHHEEDHANGIDHHHDDDINSIVVDINEQYTPEQLVSALQEIKDEYTIYRVKGFINIEGKPMRMVLQGVANRYEHYFDRKWKDGETRKTSLVIIGDKLVQDNIENSLQLCLNAQVNS